MAEVRFRILDLYDYNPKLALEYVLLEVEKNAGFGPRMWTSVRSEEGTRYGSYKVIKREHLVGRKYNIEYWDGMVSIAFTDVWYDPKTYSTYPRNEDAASQKEVSERKSD